MNARKHIAKPLDERIADCDAIAARYLANGNQAKERGARAAAERWYEKSQRWLDRANKLRGWD
jgi:hypothetical protein